MESFVERIIKTDREAREIIAAAQEQKEKALAEAVTRAETTIAKRQEEQQRQMDKQDEALSARENTAMQRADEEYIAAKHALDTTFDKHHDAWLEEIVKNCLTTA